jgi:transcriptional regulator with XRE-family HTH domain
MISGRQIRAARALLDIDQSNLAELCGLSLPTIQHMEASEGVIPGQVASLMKLLESLDKAGIELISANATSSVGGRGVRLKEVQKKSSDRGLGHAIGSSKTTPTTPASNRA